MVVRGFPARRPACAMDRQARLIILGIKQLVLLLMSDDCLRRNLAVAVPFGEGPFITRFADLRHRAVKVGGLLR
jgi:hypothetical protein